MTSKPVLSVVVPFHNEAACLPELLKRLKEVLVPLTQASYEIILVDDGSTDSSPAFVQNAAAADSKIKAITLSRNSGHQAAIGCGLEYASGQAVITMDADLQHPPEVIPQLFEKWRSGFQVVRTIRISKNRIGLAQKLTSWVFYRLFNRISEVQILPEGSDFRLLDRRALDAVLSLPERQRFLRGFVSYIGFKQTNVEFECPERFAGQRSYTFRQSFALASNALLSFSTAGLSLPFFLGLASLCVVVLYVAVCGYLIWAGVFALSAGWLSLFTLGLLSLSLQLITTGIFGLYLGKIFLEVKQRPNYFVAATQNLEGPVRKP